MSANVNSFALIWAPVTDSLLDSVLGARDDAAINRTVLGGRSTYQDKKTALLPDYQNMQVQDCPGRLEGTQSAG